MCKIRKNDEVVIIAGKDKGKRGTVIAIKKEGERVLVEGINKVKKHVKPNPQKNIEGGITEKEMSIHVSNVAIWNPVLHKADRVGFKITEESQKVRYFKSNKELIDITDN